jgi:hypothetical protein
VAVARQIVDYALRLGPVILAGDYDVSASLRKTVGCSSADPSGSAQDDRNLP